MIHSVLFDADGVLQVPAVSWRPALQALCRQPAEVAGMINDIFAAEKRCLTGHRRFVDELGPVLAKWAVDAPAETVVEIWAEIDLVEANIAVVRAVTRLGTHVGLATNQQTHRAARLVHDLGYDRLFDDLFISCHMGLAKPGTDYFLAIADQLRRAPAELLFIDDHPGNVAAAREAGLNAEVYSLDTGQAGLVSVLASHGVEVIPSPAST